MMTNPITDHFELKTPYYVFDLKALRERTAQLKEKAQQKGVSLCYAIKANPFLTPYLADLVESFEVCSHGELKICKAQELDAGKIVLSGVNKEEDFIRDGITAGVKYLTAESLSHFLCITKVAGEMKQHVRVLLRLSCGAQFGMDRSVLEDIIQRKADYEYVQIAGIHFFSGTQKKKLKKITGELDALSDFMKDLHERYGFDAELLEFGPGLAVPYFNGDDFENDLQDYEDLLSYIEQQSYPYPVVLEMGRFFTAACGTYVTGVADCKTNEGLNVCIIDGGKNHLNYYGQNMALKTPLIDHIRRDAEGGDEQTWTLFGSLCSFNDIIARDVTFTGLKTGDRLAFHNVGAYSVTEGIYLFLSRPMPDIYLLTEDGTLTRVRSGIETYPFNGGNTEL